MLLERGPELAACLSGNAQHSIPVALCGLLSDYSNVISRARFGDGRVKATLYEALRFINHASRILSDGERRERYDHELSQSNDDDLPVRESLEQALLGNDEH